MNYTLQQALDIFTEFIVFLVSKFFTLSVQIIYSQCLWNSFLPLTTLDWPLIHNVLVYLNNTYSLLVQVQLKSNLTKTSSQMSMNSTTRSVTLHHLSPAATYAVRVAAYTRVGPGPFSGLVPVARVAGPGPHAQPSQSTGQTWVIVVMFAAVIVVAVAAALFLYFKRKGAKKDISQLASKSHFFLIQLDSEWT